jgi:hypothetical protein
VIPHPGHFKIMGAFTHKLVAKGVLICYGFATPELAAD